MPQAAAHIIIPLFILSLFRDRYIKKKDKNKFPLHYVLIGGIAGIIPDLDIVAFWILNSFGFTLQQVHRTFMHTLFVPTIFLILGLILHAKKIRLCTIRKHVLHLNLIFYLLAFGSFTHLILDALLQGDIIPFYPLSGILVGLNLFGYLPKALQGLAAPSLDAGLLILWLVYLEVKHKISDFI